MQLVPLLATVLALTGQVGAAAPSDGNVIDRCFLIAIDEGDRVPATKPGKLTSVTVEEGQTVAEGDLVAQIDDVEERRAAEVAKNQYQSAKAQAENRISVEAAVKAAEVALAELDTAKEANKKVRGTFSETEERRLKLTYERSGLQKDLAEFELIVAALDARAKYAQYEQALTMIEQRQLKAPHDGVVNKLFRHKGDWVNAGEVVMQIVRMDRLRVQGRVSAARYHWRDIQGQRVEVQVLLPGSSDAQQAETVKLSGQIAFASSVIEEDGSFRFWVDVENQQQNGAWLLGPGLEASVTLLGK